MSGGVWDACNQSGSLLPYLQPRTLDDCFDCGLNAVAEVERHVQVSALHGVVPQVPKYLGSSELDNFQSQRGIRANLVDFASVLAHAACIGQCADKRDHAHGHRQNVEVQLVHR